MLIALIILSVLAAGAIALAAWAFTSRSMLAVEKARLEERLEQTAPAEERFRRLASDVIDNSARRLREDHAERLDTLLKPLRDNLDSFRQAVDRGFSDELREQHTLKEQLRALIDHTDRVRHEAAALGTALRGSNAVQGRWGETMLETLLQKAGMREGEEYETQSTVDGASRLRPDVIVKFPDGRALVIDSKVSLKDFLDWSDHESDEAAKHHVASLRNHIRALRDKNYHDLVGDRSAGFTVMFIPSEPAYMLAMRTVPALWEEAYDAGVLIASPTHLLAVLRLVGVAWRNERQERHALKIAEEAGKMYDKFAGFVDDLDKTARALDNARDTLTRSISKLSAGPGNLVGRAEKLRELGVKATKRLRADSEE